MKKIYENPQACLVQFSAEDVMTGSSIEINTTGDCQYHEFSSVFNIEI